MLNIGPQELILVLIIALVVVGPQRLPELGRSIGRALKEFRKIQDDVKDTLKFDLNEDPEPYVAPRGKSPTVSPTALPDTPTVGTDTPNGASPAVVPVEPDLDAPPRAAE
jgi:Sec-independent protein secretion pathway components